MKWEDSPIQGIKNQDLRIKHRELRMIENIEI